MPTSSTIEFVRRCPRQVVAGIYVDLSAAQDRSGRCALETVDSLGLLSRWPGTGLDGFCNWLGELNRRNAGLDWWAYTSTAKNLLSSSLGVRALEVLALRDLARCGQYSTIFVRGATGGQIRALAQILGSGTALTRVPAGARLGLDRLWRIASATARVIVHAARIYGAFLGQRTPDSAQKVDIALMTYIEGPVKTDWDNYFGDLPALLTQQKRDARIAYLAYVYTPFRALLRGLESATATPYIPLFSFMTGGSLMRAIGSSILALFPRKSRLASPGETGRAMAEVLLEALREDVATRGYLDNLLVNACATRVARRLSPARVIYPFENKSLEKALLLGVRRESPETRLIGYQHTSITPRHSTFRFSAGEADCTPLPDRIVTVGDVTRSYLEAHGRYPGGLLVAGCALRQKWDSPLPRRVLDRERPRVLLPLSSSVGELGSAVEFMRRVKARLPGLELGIRPHTNFPLRLLDPRLLDWTRENAVDLTSTPLRQNIQWADVTAYVSSTVALESLMLGRPVVYLRIDPFDPDPLLNDIAFRWRASDVDGFLANLASIAGLDAGEFMERRDDAIAYIRRYLAPRTPEALQSFLR